MPVLTYVSETRAVGGGITVDYTGLSDGIRRRNEAIKEEIGEEPLEGLAERNSL